ncbi:hypothetical protein A2U01_0004014 [Trifolium medium]|uniref:Secreted protein n=1 Tax=Trifolium medium TaxID=97028 RepID=A0A392M6W8_9FABA|nr:hypothetical protein [Trifolium medium]
MCFLVILLLAKLKPHFPNVTCLACLGMSTEQGIVGGCSSVPRLAPNLFPVPVPHHREIFFPILISADPHNFRGDP